MLTPTLEELSVYIDKLTDTKIIEWESVGLDIYKAGFNRWRLRLDSAGLSIYFGTNKFTIPSNKTILALHSKLSIKNLKLDSFATEIYAEVKKLEN